MQLQMSWVPCRLRGLAAAAMLLTGCGGGGGSDDPPNVPPVAVATAGVAAGVSPDEFCFSGRDSSDADGSVVAWQWDRQPGSSTPEQELPVDEGAALCIRVQRMQPNDPDTHIYAYLLTVTDDRGATNSVPVEAWVPENEAPSPFQGIALDAGPDQTVAAGDAVTLSGVINAGESPCNAASCAWEQLTGPDVGVSLTGSCSAGTQYNASFTAPQSPGDEVFLGFRLTVFDASEPNCESRGYVAVRVPAVP